MCVCVCVLCVVCCVCVCVLSSGTIKLLTIMIWDLAGENTCTFASTLYIVPVYYTNNIECICTSPIKAYVHTHALYIQVYI